MSITREHTIATLKCVQSLSRTEIRENRRYFVASEHKRVQRSSGNAVRDGYNLIATAARRYWNRIGAVKQSAENRGGLVARHAISKSSYLSEVWPRIGADYLVGIELEIELPDLDEGESASDPVVVELVRCGLGKDVVLTTDGSLTNGVELVFLPRTIAEIRERKRELIQLFNGLIDLGYTSQSGGLIGSGYKANAGVHVHVSRSALTDYQWERLQCLVCAPRLSRVLQTISGRADSNNSYCCYSGPVPDQYSRYRPLNLTPSDTREFRIFGGTLDYYRLIGYLETVRVLVDAIKRDSAVSELDLITLLGRSGWVRRLSDSVDWDVDALTATEKSERAKNREIWQRFARELRFAVQNQPEIIYQSSGVKSLADCKIDIARDCVGERIWKAAKQESGGMLSQYSDKIRFTLQKSRRVRGSGVLSRVLRVVIRSAPMGGARIYLE